MLAQQARLPVGDRGLELGLPTQAVPQAWQPARPVTPPARQPVRWPWLVTAGVGIFLCGLLAVVGWSRFHARHAVAQQDPSTTLPAPNQHSTHPITPPVKPIEPPRPVTPPRTVAPPKTPVITPPEDSPDEPSDDTEPSEPSELNMPGMLNPPDLPTPVPAHPQPASERPGPTERPSVRLAAIPQAVDLPAVGVIQPPSVLFPLAAAADYSLKLRGPRMVDGAQLTLKRTEPGHWQVLAEFASAFGGSEKIAQLEQRDGGLTFAWEPLKTPEQRVRSRELRNYLLLVEAGGIGERVVALRKPVRAHPLTMSFGPKPAETKWQVNAPPAGSYSVAFQAGGNLALVPREHTLSVNLRSEPVATPVQLAVELSPPKVFGKQMLHGRVDGTIRLKYRGVAIAREHLKADDPAALEPTQDPEPITPEELHGYIAALGQQLRADAEQLKTLPPPPGAPPPPPGDEKAQKRRQLEHNIRGGQQRMRNAQALNRLFTALETAKFDYQLSCEVDGQRVIVVSTAEPLASPITSAPGP